MLILNIFIEHNFLIVFLILAILKGVVELWVGTRKNRAGKPSSRLISILFIISGSLKPLFICCEILLFTTFIPLLMGIILAVIQISLMILRIFCVKTLGIFYSVDVRIKTDHSLITTGIYRYLRHPLYLTGLLENICYPLACGAFFSTIIFTVFETPVLLIRRHQEEKLLVEKFGNQYLTYKKKTLF